MEITLDVETYPDFTPFCISICGIDLKPKFYRWNKSKPPKEVIDMLRDHHITKIYHNAKADIKWCKYIGMKTHGKVHDTLLLAKIGLPFEPSYALKELARKYLDEECKLDQEVKEWLRKNKCKDFSLIPEDLLRRYNMEDTRITMKLFYFLKEVINDKLYQLEIALINPIINMESAGIRINLSKTEELLDKYNKEVENIREYFKVIRNIDNLNSPQQVSHLIYDKLKLDLPYWKGATHRSTDSLALVLLQKKYPKVKDIEYLLTYREKFTKVKMFLMPFLAIHKDGYVYPEFNQFGDMDKRRIKTGRFSSSNPNFQNIPRGNEIRQLIIPRKDHVFLDLDYNQVEMRLFAFMAKDELMMKMYSNNEDLHNVHRKIFVDPYRVDDGTNRQIAKSIGFEILYGIGAPGMLRYLNRMKIFIEEDVVKKMIYGWHEIHPSLTDYKRILYRSLRRNGFIEDLYGRKYFLPLAKSYMAVNYAIQGMSANVMKDVIPEIDEYVNMIDGNMLLTIHDELLIELPKKQCTNDNINRIRSMMESPSKKIGVPLTVNHQIMTGSWGEKK